MNDQMIEGSKELIFKELNDFFDEGTSDKVKTLNDLLITFMIFEGYKNVDQKYVHATVQDVTDMVNFLTKIQDRLLSYRSVSE